MRDLLLLGLLFISQFAMSADKRVALVIGNAEYTAESKLRNPVNDAGAMAKVLTGLGFTVTEITDANWDQFDASLGNFYKSLSKAEIGLFYYSGHGMRDDQSNANYLLPVDASISRSSHIARNGFAAKKILNEMNASGVNVSLMFLDACRNNPFSTGVKGVSKGLARIAAPTGSLVGFAADYGQTADDGDGEHGTYTDHLLTHLTTPNISIVDLLTRVRSGVLQSSSGQQRPVEENRLTEPLYLAGQGVQSNELSVASNTSDTNVTLQEPANTDKEIILWNEVKQTNDVELLQLYLSLYPNGVFSSLAKVMITRLTHAKESSNSAVAHLFVNPEPENARIRILNISPKYQRGMNLPISRDYRIEVTATGFTSYDKLHTLKPGDQVINIRLEPVKKSSAIEPKMVRIRGGSFIMGSPGDEEGREDDELQHDVTIKSFFMSKHEVTVQEFSRFIDATDYLTDAEKFSGEESGCWSFDKDEEIQWYWRDWANWQRPHKYVENRDNDPISCVSFNDVMEYIDWLNKESGRQYRLPTEAEWEYAARGGVKKAHFWGDISNQACRYANVVDKTSHEGTTWNSNFECTDNYFFVAPVGTFITNPFNLHDMLGNVWEWTCSLYTENYNGEEEKCAPEQTDGRRSVRGGSYDVNPTWLRSANRAGDPRDNRSSYIGFRLVRTK